MNAPRSCRGCAAVISPGPRERNPRVWCSGACRARWLRENKPEQQAAIAERRRAKVAAEAEAARGYCEVCKAKLPPGHRRCCSSDACQRAAHAARAREMYARDRDAGAARMRVQRAARTEEQKLAAKTARRAWVTRAGGRAAASARSDARRRERIRAATVEPFTREEIFERDGWTCWLCEEPIDQALAFPDPGSVSLDHVVPIAAGGEHSRANARASHLGCNVGRPLAR